MLAHQADSCKAWISTKLPDGSRSIGKTPWKLMKLSDGKQFIKAVLYMTMIDVNKLHC